MIRNPPGEIVDLGERRAKERPADVRLVLELWQLEDGRVAYEGRVEEFVPEGAEPRATYSWLREHLRWAILAYARVWRLGIVRREAR